MCGVPVHAAEGYLLTLIRKGFRVAVCEQMEDPAEAKKRGSKSVVKRDVVRLVTPGTLTEESLLEARRHNFLAAFAEVREAGALAWVDISTGEFRVMPCPRSRLSPELARLAPREVLLSETMEPDLAALVSDIGGSSTPLSRASFDSAQAEKRLTACSGSARWRLSAAFRAPRSRRWGRSSTISTSRRRASCRCCARRCAKPRAKSMQIDAATRRNLELTHALSGGRDGSLLAAIDRTVTAGGARLLERRLSAALARRWRRSKRGLDAVDFMVERRDRAEAICAPRCAARPIWTAPCRGWRWTAAGRAIWPRSAMPLPQADDIAHALAEADLPDLLRRRGARV